VKQLVLASSNSGKLAELVSILEPLGIRASAQSEWQVPDAVEDGASFLENALIKARNAAALTGLPALGDDSGLVVAALDGRPGIYSARFSGEQATAADNNRKLLQELAGIRGGDRQAYFYCAMVLLRSPADPAPLVATGRWNGRILNVPRGAGGFGYDPLFEVPQLGKSAAELEPDLKNRISHRGQALHAIVEQLQKKGPDTFFPSPESTASE
jgi:XTP/dITP diphosphohydrolase